MFSNWDQFVGGHRLWNTFSGFSEILPEITHYFFLYLICISNSFQMKKTSSKSIDKRLKSPLALHSPQNLHPIAYDQHAQFNRVSCRRWQPHPWAHRMCCHVYIVHCTRHVCFASVSKHISASTRVHYSGMQQSSGVLHAHAPRAGPPLHVFWRPATAAPVCCCQWLAGQ